ncbi:MAG: Fic family protein [Deltaproteobacteria bacterium]|nr:Fic family protein [Deltaproteobacteria bacterium]
MFFEFDDFDVRERFFAIEEKVQNLKDTLKNKSEDFNHKFQDMCSRAYVMHDSALDGQVISNEDIYIAFESKIRLSIFKNRIMHEIKNHRKLFQNMCLGESQAYQPKKIRYDDVVKLHCELYENVCKRETGQFRRIIPLHGTYLHDLMEPVRIKSKLQELCKQTEHPEFKAQHPINQAVIFHTKFMRVFPFLEGSGKLGRLYMNSFLRQGGYSSAIIHGSERQRYYESLRSGQESLREFLLDNMDSCLESQIKYMSESA